MQNETGACRSAIWLPLRPLNLLEAENMLSDSKIYT